MRSCIVNADDFGASEGINRGVFEAHEHGVLTSASLMVDMPGSEGAATAARSHPRLGVGLHFDLRDARPENGSPPDLARVRSCLRAQIESFLRLMDTLPTHLDVHHNLHRVPEIAPCFEEIATRHGLPLREHGRVRYFSRFYGRWDGESHPEQISVERLLAMLADEIEAPITEVACHPGYRDPGFRSEYDAEREMELRTLCDPALRAGIERLGIQLIDHRDVPRAAA
jgi:predicted glycoside hydrolase/deacetylase ChbG (UPF0249 family)